MLLFHHALPNHHRYDWIINYNWSLCHSKNSHTQVPGSKASNQAQETFPTTTTSTTTITTTTAIPSPGCAIVGCNQGAIDRPGLFATPQQCHDACVNFPGCKGYQIGPVPDGRMNCNLEGLPALQAAAPNADGSISDYCSQFLIYDVACPVPATCLTCF